MPRRQLCIALLLVLLGGTSARADLDVYLNSLNVSAQTDIGGFRADLGLHFGASEPQLDLVFRSVRDPGDAFLCLWLGRQTRQPVDVVLRHYHSQRGKGWGALAQSLGIKPGSPAFKDLKSGDLGWRPASAARHSGKERHEADQDDHGGRGNGKGKRG